MACDQGQRHPHQSAVRRDAADEGRVGGGRARSLRLAGDFRGSAAATQLAQEPRLRRRTPIGRAAPFPTRDVAMPALWWPDGPTNRPADEISPEPNGPRDLHLLRTRPAAGGLLDAAAEAR